MQYLKQSCISLAVCLTLFAGINFVIANGYSWKTPSQEGYSISGNTPTGNVATPLNVGTTGQSKSGGLYLGAGLSAGGFGLIVDKNVRFTNFLSCQSLGTDASGNITCAGGCTPNCAGKVCGDNGCGGSCGTCTSPATCNASGQCVSPSYTYSYSNWSSWGSCSVACGGGTQRRARDCLRNGIDVVSCGLCGGACEENQNCNTQVCCSGICTTGTQCSACYATPPASCSGWDCTCPSHCTRRLLRNDRCIPPGEMYDVLVPIYVCE